MKNILITLLYSTITLFSSIIQAKENINQNTNYPLTPLQTLAFNCAAGSAQTELNINNVKTLILNGGDMWWDTDNPKYEIPIGSGSHSLFAGALWIGGYDDNGQLKVAGQTYRQSGTDYWPGPLDNVRLNSDSLPNLNYGTTDAAICSQYDQHFIVNKNEVIEFVAWSNSENPDLEFPDYVIPQSIIEYPGNRTTDDLTNLEYNNETESYPYYALESLAPFQDVDGDGFYNPLSGDYPQYNLYGNIDCGKIDVLYGDQTIWWVFNDNGNTHTATGSETAIGLEIQAQAFAIGNTSIDGIDNSTFYNYKIINRSHAALNDTYIGLWTDPDLGNHLDDYVGCDVGRGLGYCYNGDEMDEDGEWSNGYGINPPAIGIDFFRGPTADENDGIDNNRNGVVDESLEDITMSKFLYFNNTTGTVDGNPSVAQDFYNYLDGKWLDGSLMTYGGNGRDQNNPISNYMFSEGTDPEFTGQTWTEQTAGNLPADRRFIQSAGKFTLAPGAINHITSGVVWSRADEGGAWASVEKLKLDDDSAQFYFDNCFIFPCISPNASLATYSIVEENYGYNMEYTVEFNYPYLDFNPQLIWDFGDGVISSNLIPSHTYNEPGTYSVSLTIVNECGEDNYVFDINVPYVLNTNSIIGVPIERVEGVGSSDRNLELSEESLVFIRDNYSKQIIEYIPNHGPFLIHIPDTSNVEYGDYEIKVLDVGSDDFIWQITQLSTEESFANINSDGFNEAYDFNFTNWGFDIQINQVVDIGDNGANINSTNGFITSSTSDSSWLDYYLDSESYSAEQGIVNLDGMEINYYVDPSNWIRSGLDAIDHQNIDNGEAYENVLNGAWAPYRLIGVDGQNGSNFQHSPAWEEFQSLSYMRDLPSVDIVFTDDTALWTRVPVIETDSSSNRLNLKINTSVDKFGSPDSSGTHGFSWFPGYAIDLEKGIRLNMMFGESSSHPDNNGNDMIWNPTSVISTGEEENFNLVLGGRHYLYIMKTKYAGADATAHSEYDHLIGMTSNSNKRSVFREAAWVSIPLLHQDANLLSEDVTVKIRVSKPLEEYSFEESGILNVDYQNGGFPLYRFTIDGDYSAYGCMDSTACNFNENAIVNDESCFYEDVFYNCNGECINDSDLDGTCDELEIEGCTDETACNYNIDATEDNSSCVYSEEYYNCNNECVNDFDDDSICDELDNCPDISNLEQVDFDNDGEGDACDYDDEISIHEIISKKPKLIKMIDVIGRKHNVHRKGTLLFYIYDDGTVKEVYK